MLHAGSPTSAKSCNTSGWDAQHIQTKRTAMFGVCLRGRGRFFSAARQGVLLHIEDGTVSLINVSRVKRARVSAACLR